MPEMYELEAHDSNLIHWKEFGAMTEASREWAQAQYYRVLNARHELIDTARERTRREDVEEAISLMQEIIDEKAHYSGEWSDRTEEALVKIDSLLIRWGFEYKACLYINQARQTFLTFNTYTVEEEPVFVPVSRTIRLSPGGMGTNQVVWELNPQLPSNAGCLLD